MDSSFWIENWRTGKIGFHQGTVNAALEKHWRPMPDGTSVLVPLCGKSLDMLWLEKQGLQVTGIELAEQAILDFCHENALAFSVNHRDTYTSYRLHNKNIRLIAGDFFAFADQYTDEPFDSLYDRAALVALPIELRKPYVTACQSLLSEPVAGMVITLEYEQELMNGPPYSVSADEAQRLWKGALNCVAERDILDELGKAKAAGVPGVQEITWVL